MLPKQHSKKNIVGLKTMMFTVGLSSFHKSYYITATRSAGYEASRTLFSQCVEMEIADED